MKYRILEELKSRDKEYISGEEISRRLGVSRTAVWKYINRLRQEGYNIESQTNSGYKLVQSPDTLSSFEIQPLLKTRFIGREILYFDSIDSTNSYAKKMGEENIKDGTVIIADEQTSGRGRLGRQWMSPKGKGIWMTILLKPHIAPSEASKITLAAAYVLCTALDKCGLDVRIKWPNDIVVNGKKLCGILTEMSADMDIIKYIVVGIGLNANLDAHDFDSAIAATATSIKIEAGKSISRKTVVSHILNEFERVYDIFTKEGSIESFLEEYKLRSAVIGKEIRVIYRKEELRGKAVDVTEEGHLIIKLEDGSTREILSGEVSIRSVNGYI